MFGFAAGESRILAAFRRAYNATADKTLSPGGFYQRLTPLFTVYLRDLVEFTFVDVPQQEVGGFLPVELTFYLAGRAGDAERAQNPRFPELVRDTEAQSPSIDSSCIRF